MEKRRLKMGMVGGGITGFIGAIHLRAALMENRVELAVSYTHLDVYKRQGILFSPMKTYPTGTPIMYTDKKSLA